MRQSRRRWRSSFFEQYNSIVIFLDSALKNNTTMASAESTWHL